VWLRYSRSCRLDPKAVDSRFTHEEAKFVWFHFALPVRTNNLEGPGVQRVDEVWMSGSDREVIVDENVSCKSDKRGNIVLGRHLIDKTLDT